MQIIKIKKNKISQNDIDLVAEYLRSGKVAILPTDTIYGLSCAANDKKAIDKIYRIKRREKKRPFLVLVNGYGMLRKYVFVSKKQEQYIRSVWPPTARLAQDKNHPYVKRPTTFILKCRKNLPENVNNSADSLAVRLPKNDFLIRIIKKIDLPLVSTSLNISGQDNVDDLQGIDKFFVNPKPDFMVISGGSKKIKESRIIDIRDINNIKIIRK